MSERFTDKTYDYENECYVYEREMPKGSERWRDSEKARVLDEILDGLDVEFKRIGRPLQGGAEVYQALEKAFEAGVVAGGEQNERMVVNA